MRTLYDVVNNIPEANKDNPNEVVDQWKEFNADNPDDINKFVGTKIFKTLLEAYKMQLESLTLRLYETKDNWELTMIQGKIHTYRSIISNYENLIKISKNI